MGNYKTKVCQRCGKEYQPTNNRQKYCVECGQIIRREAHAKWNKANPEKRRKDRAKYYEANSVKIIESLAKYRKTHPGKDAEYGAIYRKTHPEKRAESQAEYGRSHPMVSRLKDVRRRSLKYANTPLDEMLTSTEWLAILAQADGHCAYCDKEAKLTLDHVIPLSKGGKHSKDNVVPACGHCNSSKGNKTLEEWNAKRLTQASN